MILSVIIPAYNRKHLIGETLKSLLAQTLSADEIIVVDDGSTDDTAAVACRIGPPVRVIRQANKGPGAARNAGLLASRGKYIHFFDSDDLAAPNKHEVQVSALESSGADIAYGPWARSRFGGGRCAVSGHVLQRNGLPRVELVKALLTHWSVVPHAAIFRRTCVEGIGGFPEDIAVGEDQYMFLRCLLGGARVIHTPETIEFYRIGERGKITESAHWGARRTRDLAAFLLKAREECLRHGVEPCRWFGYRRRLWEAEQDLRHSRCDDGPLLDGIRDLLRGWTPAWCYHWHRQIERWYGGLCWRMTGGRAHRYFRSGEARAADAELLAGLGYELAPTKRAPWWPRRHRGEVRCAG